jgi:hypothetical protein
VDAWRLKLKPSKSSVLLREQQIFVITLNGTDHDAVSPVDDRLLVLEM